MPESNEVGERTLGPLSSLPDRLPSTRIGLVRRLWPQIDAALNAGHNLVAVHESLREGGFDIPYSTLTACVHRIRREQSRPLRHRPHVAEKADQTRPEPDSSAPRDPLANLKKYGSKYRPRFEWTGIPDPSKLF